MLRLSLLLITLFSYVSALEIKKHSIDYFKRERMVLTKAYIESHYGITARNGTIVPKIIVIHSTGIDDLEASLKRFEAPILPHDRGDISRGGSLNVSAHFVVDRDGTVYQLMPANQMARHVIGLNYSSIGIENVGGADHKDNLTPQQLRANAELIAMLQEKYEDLEYLIGHYEYRCFEGDELWLERDSTYRTEKSDPGKRFMEQLRINVRGLRPAPCNS